MKLLTRFKMKLQKTGNYIVDYYNSYNEDDRLNSRHGNIEFLTTIKYIEKYLQSGMKIIEIGAGTGKYSHYFARNGYSVDAVELVERNIEKFKTKTLPHEKITIVQGNALDLHDFPSDSYDITLLLGPMYHLYTIEEQKQAIMEALRITNHDGIVFVAYCMGDSAIFDHGFTNGKIQNIAKKFMREPNTYVNFTKPEDLFKLTCVQDIRKLMTDFDIEPLHLVATDGFAKSLRNELKKMTEKDYQFYLSYHYAICEREDLIGVSPHTLDIFRKR